MGREGEKGEESTAARGRESFNGSDAGNSSPNDGDSPENVLSHAVSSITPASTIPTSKIASSLLKIRERRNWLIHHLYTRQEYVECLSVIEAQLRESEGVCEYALYVKGLLKRRSGDLTESFLLFQTAMLINPQNPVNQKQVARALFLLGQHRAAIDSLKETEDMCAINGVGEDWTLQYGIGMCHMYLNDYKQAETAFVKSISIQRRDCTIMQLGKVLVLQKEYERAISLYEEALQTTPDNPDLLTTLGLLHLKVNKPAKAFHYVGKCLTLNSSNPTAIMVAAGIMQENGDFSVALNKYRVAVSKLPHSARLWSNIGMCFFGQQNMHAAVACLRKAVALAPLEWRIAYNMGLVFLHLKQYASAFHYLSASTYLHGQYAPAFMHLGVCLALMNDVENACAAYARALAIDPDPFIRLNYSITLFNSGKEEESRQQLEVFLQAWENAQEMQRRDWGPIVSRTVRLLTARLRGEKEMNCHTAVSSINNDDNNIETNDKKNDSSTVENGSAVVENDNANHNKNVEGETSQAVAEAVENEGGSGDNR
ncbi:BBS4-like protein 4 [Trypanosoma grayi]|uniref:BBS4-like protein 4 n=1 Tax=Trypanosoma grayi TaxID=71804 RepID=UPI0004F40DE5|nr:BBS4-like protein 4 [Trypanosoma grayi]KEG13380.1 BBS4-like protein 4 [Trypanosoma grayi]